MTVPDRVQSAQVAAGVMAEQAISPRPWLGLYKFNFAALQEEQRMRSEYRSTTQPASSDDAGGGETEISVGILSLPVEIVNKILSNLHAEQLSTLAQVCKGWLAFVYEPRHWKRLAHKMWPIETPRQLEQQLYTYKTWRRVVTLRPRVRTNGIYVVRHQFSKVSTRTVSSEPVAPVFLVIYHRCLRFYSDGCVVSLTTPEPLDRAYRRLQKSWTPSAGERDKAHPSVGHYRFHESSLEIDVTLPMSQANYPNMRQGTMVYRFRVDGTHPGAWNRLLLIDHFVVMDQADGRGDIITFNVDSFGTKPFRFVPIWGFRTRVYRNHFPKEERNLAKWSLYAATNAADS